MIIIITMINKRNEDNKDFRKIVFLKIIIMIITEFFSIIRTNALMLIQDEKIS